MILSPSPDATDGALCATRREAWVPSFDCGAGAAYARPSTPLGWPTRASGSRTSPLFCSGTPALYLNQRGGRLSVKGAHDVITTITADPNLDEQLTAHTLRHTFATRLVRGRVDLITVAELLGHARLETTRVYSRPTHEDRAEALNHLDVDR